MRRGHNWTKVEQSGVPAPDSCTYSACRTLLYFYTWAGVCVLTYIYLGSTVYSYNNVMYIYEGDHSTFSRTLEYSGFRTCVKVIVGRSCFDSAVLCSRSSELGVECSRRSDQGGVLRLRMGRDSALSPTCPSVIFTMFQS